MSEPPSILYHISDRPDIAVFEPRPSPNSGHEGDMVWAVDDDHLHNYLLPRGCPRVTFYALPDSRPDDVERLFAGSPAQHIVVIESSWFAAARIAQLTRYDLPAASFTLVDSGAGYYISRKPVVPLAVNIVDDPLGEMLRRDVELRVMSSLWRLHNAVAASSLQFSIIRMRNAAPPTCNR